MTTAAVAYARRLIATRRKGQTLAIVTPEGVWVNGAVMPFVDYVTAYGDAPRQELTIDGLTLADLAGPFS